MDELTARNKINDTLYNFKMRTDKQFCENTVRLKSIYKEQEILKEEELEISQYKLTLQIVSLITSYVLGKSDYDKPVYIPIKNIKYNLESINQDGIELRYEDLQEAILYLSVFCDELTEVRQVGHPNDLDNYVLYLKFAPKNEEEVKK